MKVLVVLPNNSFEKVFWDQTKKHINHHFQDYELCYLAPSGLKEKYELYFCNLIEAKDNPIILCDEIAKIGDIKHVVLLLNSDGSENSAVFHDVEGVKYYFNYLQGYGGISRIRLKDSDSRVFKLDKQNHFYQITGNSNNTIFFPYLNYTFTNSKFGKEESNEYGFRVPVNLDYVKARKKDTKLIVFTGGSACYGYSSFAGHRFSDKVEELIRNNKDLKDKYIVLNFAFEGHMLLNEMITYLIFIMELKPDYVVSFSLLNDLMMGSVSDPKLLNEYSLAYPIWLEDMAANFSKTNDLLPWKRRNCYPLSTIDNVVQACFNRLVQYKTLVENNGGRFISIMQPIVYSKTRSHSLEKLLIKSSKVRSEKELSNKDKILMLFNEMSEFVNKNDINDFYNFHVLYKKYNEQHHLFSDSNHFTEDGEKETAKNIYDLLIDNGYVI